MHPSCAIFKLISAQEFRSDSISCQIEFFHIPFISDYFHLIKKLNKNVSIIADAQAVEVAAGVQPIIPGPVAIAEHFKRVLEVMVAQIYEMQLTAARAGHFSQLAGNFKRFTEVFEYGTG